MALTMTMTMTPWNLTQGQWSKNLTMATDIPESAPWSMVKMVILWSNFVVDQRFTILTIENLYLVHGHGQNWCFWPWSWSKF